MANRSTYRSNAPSSLAISPHPKATISLEEWEAKAPLTDLQIRSVNAVKVANDKVPLPFKFLAEEKDDSLPSTPIPRAKDKFMQQHGSGSRPSTPPIAGKHAHALHPKQPVQTPQQFYDWFALIDRSVAHSQEAHYRAHVAMLSEHLETCDLLLNRIGEIDASIDEMLEAWKSVEEGGKSLKDACERLLEERDELLLSMENIGGHLEYFQELEHATRMLNHPGEALIFQADFLDMVERVDICIDFLKNHRHYREAEVYLLRFHQCMTRAMTLIKMNFVGSLRALSSEVYKRLTDKEVSTTAQLHLLYTRFNTVAMRIAPLLGELERRAQAYPDELSALLAECYAAYFSTRKTLLVPRITEEIRGLDPSRSELVELTRSGCSYLKQLCTDEFNLYRDFFSTAEDQLYQYLETLCDLLYDDLRPRILHEPRLTVLCEVCTVLQALMVLDASSLSTPSITTSDAESGDDDDDESEASTHDDELTVNLDDPHRGTKKLGRRLHTSHLLKMVLQDAQTRLFFKAQAVIQSEIRHFVPKPEDLAYPDILVAARKPLTGTEIREKESYSQLFRGPSLDRQDTWYPTLRKTVWILAQLHDFVKPAIFEDIAQEALTFCRQSILSAADLIKTRSTSTSVLDAALFLTRHFLVLKDVFNNLESDIRQQREDEGTSAPDKVPVSSRSLEFTGVTDTLTSMLNRTTSLLPEGLFATLGVTRGVETDMRGVKMDIDQGLRNACADVISACSAPVCDPMDTWTLELKGRSHLLTGVQPSQFERPPGSTTATPASAVPLPAQIAAESDNISLRFLETLNRDLRSSVGRVRLYLEDERTVRILLDHVQDKIMESYAEYRGVVTRLGLGQGGDGQGQLLSTTSLRDMLTDICSEEKR